MSKLLIILISVGFLVTACAGKNLVLDPIKIQGDVLTIGGCAVETGGCVMVNCGGLMAACAAEKCDPIALSICLVGKCGNETKDCVEQIMEVIQN